MAKPPPIDHRTAAEITQQVNDLLLTYLPSPPADAQPDPIRRALIGAFARFSEIIIQRLNQVPQKNFLAFLNLLGASRLPPQPARVPLTFFLAQGSSGDGVVPARTQVAAPPVEGERDPVIFETERELIVTAAKLESIYVRNPDTDLVGDYRAIAIANHHSDVFAFQGNQKIEHCFYIANDAILSYANLKALRLTFTLTTSIGSNDQREMVWEYWDGNQYQPVTPIADGTQQLRQNGNIILGNEALNHHASFLPEFKSHTVHQITKRWLCCRLITPINSTGRSLNGMVQAEQLPTINTIRIQPTLQESNLLIDAAFTNQIPIDLSKNFFPFGEQPKIGDACFLASQTVFSKQRATIELTITLTPIDEASGIRKPAASNIELTWEYWNSRDWIAFGISTLQGGQVPAGVRSSFEDTTQALTETGLIRFVLPTDATHLAVNGINNYWIRVRITRGNYGVDGKYIPVKVRVGDTEIDTFTFQPPQFTPPFIQKLLTSYTCTPIEPPNPLPVESLPEVVLAHNDGRYDIVPLIGEDLNRTLQPFQPFQKTNVDFPTLYLGFTLPIGRSRFPNRPLTLFCRTADVKYGDRAVPLSPLYSRRARTDQATVTHTFIVTHTKPFQADYRISVFATIWATDADAGAVDQNGLQTITVQVTIPNDAQLTDRDRGFLKLTMLQEPQQEFIATFETVASQELPALAQPQLQWHYWNGQVWKPLTVRDESENLTRTGLIQFLPPADFALKPADRLEFGFPDRYWLRAQWHSGQYPVPPKLQGLLLNTTTAAQTVTMVNEILGSSDGTENQRCRTTRSPILNAPQLHVRELELPSAEERKRIQAIEGDDSITEVRQSNGQLQEVWVRWHEVPDFYGSEPRDRHYVLDHLTGEVRFGNGINGLIPPIGTGNLRMTHYQTGGGSSGNRPSGAIVQLKTTIPYVDKVTNPEPATGGADAEMLESLMARSPRTIRHRSRAVTFEDYQDLAMLASPTVARAKCVPLRNLVLDPTDQASTLPGEVSVIIVPTSTDAKPLPSMELINRVQAYLSSHSLPTVNVSVVGPLYVQVRITAEIAIAALEGASEVEQAVMQHLTRFLHPLTGGFEGTGWEFGREPYKSDFYRLLEGISGVDHIRTLQVIDGTGTAEVDAIKATHRFLVYSGQHTITLTFGDP